MVSDLYTFSHYNYSASVDMNVLSICIGIVLSNDPGRVNIMYIIAQDYDGNIIFTKKLTRKYYYHAGKINEHQRRVTKWNNTHSTMFAGLSINHFKTSNLTAYMQSIRFYSDESMYVWEHMGGVRKWSHAKFRLYRSKTKTIDKFLESLIPRTYFPRPRHQLFDRPIMLYGSGEFPSGAKGERNVPLKYIKDRCKNYFDCHIVNEFRTSQVCHHCKQLRLFDYARVSPDTTSIRTIRGLKWCNSAKCKKNPIKCRDEVGATNIMIRGRNDINPDNPLFDRQKVRWHKSSPKQKLFYARRNMMDAKK